VQTAELNYNCYWDWSYEQKGALSPDTMPDRENGGADNECRNDGWKHMLQLLVQRQI
jgi:hypothetical protein